MIIGTGFYSYTIGNMTAMILSLDEDNEELQKKYDTVKKVNEKYKLPFKLRERIENHITKSQENKKFFDSERLLGEVPAYLRSEIVAITHKGI
jgi:hyperpolarization activated cyclic nucleotide-gated potassium channel 2